VAATAFFPGIVSDEAAFDNRKSGGISFGHGRPCATAFGVA
jgi:hypothetical protein